MAKQVESLFNVEKPVQDATLPMPRTASLTAGEIKRELARKGMRVSGLAKHFKVEAWEIETIIKNPANGLEIGDKGWVKNKGNPIVD